MSNPEQLIRVEDGTLSETCSWVYVWVRRCPDPAVVYVGATGLPLAVRTWLHLNDDNPDVGRIRAHFPEAMAGSVEVVGFKVDGAIDRRQVRATVAGLLSGTTVTTGVDERVLDLASYIVERIHEIVGSE